MRNVKDKDTNNVNDFDDQFDIGNEKNNNNNKNNKNKNFHMKELIKIKINGYSNNKNKQNENKENLDYNYIVNENDNDNDNDIINKDNNHNQIKNINLSNNFFCEVGEKTEDKKKLHNIFSKDVFLKSDKSIKFKYNSINFNKAFKDNNNNNKNENANTFNQIISIKGEAKIHNIESHIKNQQNLFENFNEIRDSWKFSIYEFFCYSNFPEEKIRNYFGEKICLYYLFLDLYLKFLTIISLLGIIVYILQMTDSYESYDIEIFYNKGYLKSRYIIVINTFYTFFVIIWSTIFIEIWNRKEAKYASLWGHGQEEDEIETKDNVLPTFKGKIGRSPFNDEMNEPYFPRYKFITRQIIAYSISIFIVIVEIIIVVLLLLYKNHISFNKLGGEYHSLYLQFPSKKA